MNLDAQRGARIRDERDRLGWSQQQAADFVGIRREMWAKYEAGSEPGANALAGMSKNDVDVTYILTGERVSDWERNVFARTARTIAQTESDPNGSLHQSHRQAINAAGKRQTVRRTEFIRLEQALASCNDEDCTLVMDIALTLASRLARGGLVKPAVTVKKTTKKVA